MVFYHSRLANELTATIESVQKVSKRKSFIKQPLFQELPYIKLHLKMYAFYYTDV